MEVTAGKTGEAEFILHVTREELERIFILSYRGENLGAHHVPGRGQAPTLAHDIPNDVQGDAIRRFHGHGKGTVLV